MSLYRMPPIRPLFRPSMWSADFVFLALKSRLCSLFVLGLAVENSTSVKIRIEMVCDHATQKIREVPAQRRTLCYAHWNKQVLLTTKATSLQTSIFCATLTLRLGWPRREKMHSLPFKIPFHTEMEWRIFHSLS